MIGLASFRLAHVQTQGRSNKKKKKLGKKHMLNERNNWNQSTCLELNILFTTRFKTARSQIFHALFKRHRIIKTVAPLNNEI